MNMKVIAITVVLLAALILVSILTINTVKKNVGQKPKASDSPDSFVTNLTYTKMDEKGVVKMVFYSPYLVNYQAKNYVEFQKPDITLTNQQGAPWHITADKGSSDNSSKVMNLIDNVRLQQAGKTKLDNLLITTSTAKVQLDEKYATTDKPITIQRGEFTVNAVGANADLNKGIVNLLSNVREVYVPQ
jgi:lipopolysaccharide export system protein LptC